MLQQSNKKKHNNQFPSRSKLTQIHKQPIRKYSLSTSSVTKTSNINQQQRIKPKLFSSQHYSFSTSQLTSSITIPHPQQLKPHKLYYHIIRINGGVTKPTKIYEGIFDPQQDSSSSSSSTTIIPNTEYQKAPIRIVFQHALLASKGYWLPFLRSLHTQFQSTLQLTNDSTTLVSNNNTTNNILFDSTTPIDLYIPDLELHSETAMINDPNDPLHPISYLMSLAGDLHHFITKCVLTQDELNHIQQNNQQQQQRQQQIPNIGIVSHSLGARTSMLWNLLLNGSINENNSIISNDSTTNIINNKNNDNLTQYLSTIPIVNFDSAPSTYSHNHQHLFQAMLGVENIIPTPTNQNNNTTTTNNNNNTNNNNPHKPQNYQHPFLSRQSLKHSLQSLSSELDDNTIAFAIQNNYSSTSLHDILQQSNTQYNQDYLHNKLQLPCFNNNQQQYHFWTSNIQKLNQVEHQVHQWPLLTPTTHQLLSNNTQQQSTSSSQQPPQYQQGQELNPHLISSLPLLSIGGLDSSRLTTQSNLIDMKHFFPNAHIEMIRGGHFCFQGADMPKAAQLTVDYFTKHFSQESQH